MSLQNCLKRIKQKKSEKQMNEPAQRVAFPHCYVRFVSHKSSVFKRQSFLRVSKSAKSLAYCAR